MFFVLYSESQAISKEFLFFALRQSFSLKQMEQRSSGGNYPAITGEELQKIKIPVPPIEVQEQIIEKFETAYNAKRAKEAEARNLLDGIDAYLLDKLGIETPAATETKKTFFTRASKLSGGRFDPFYHHADFVVLEKALHESKYPIVQLSKVCDKITDGTHYTPKYQDSGVLFLSVKNVREERFELDDVKYISEEEHAFLTKRCKPEANDVLLTKVGTVGLVQKLSRLLV